MDQEIPGSVQCCTCLSPARRLKGLGRYSTVFQQVVGPTKLKVSQMLICWECEAVLRSVVRFQNKVSTANNVFGQTLHPSLSTLTITLLTDTQTPMVHDAVLSIEFPKAKEESKCIQNEPETSPEEDFYFTQDNAEDDLRRPSINEEIATELSNEVQPIKTKADEPMQPKIKNKTNRWAMKKALQNKKPKYTVIQLEKTNQKNMFARVSVDATELTECLEKERQSDYYRNKKYKCDKCVTGFAQRDSLTAHKKKCHKKEVGKYTCDVCQTRFPERALLARHCRGHYFKFVCNVCKYTCAARSHMLWHYKTHEKLYQCCECALKFKSRKEFYDHYKRWHETFICDLCGTSFKMRYCIEEHIRKQHSPHHCVACDKRFARYNGLWLHNKLKHAHMRPPPAYCVECDKHFNNVYAYKWHLNNSVHHNARPRQSVPCPACHKVFTKKIYMRNHHDLVHLKIYRYRCEQCDKNFLRNAELVKHTRRVHEQLAPRRDKICRVCQRGFTCNKILNNHIRIHTGERPFACDRCSARFAQRAALTSHLKNVHKHKYTHDDT